MGISSLLSGNNKNANNNDPAQKAGEGSLSVIAAGAVIVGDVVSTGVLRVEGKVYGRLVCRSKLVVGKKGYIEGDVDAQSATVEGEITGRIIVRDALQLLETARVSGDITTDKISIQQGGLITGAVRMGKEAKQILQDTPVPDLLAQATKAGRAALNPAANGRHDEPAEVAAKTGK